MDVNFNTRAGFGHVGGLGAEVAPQMASQAAETKSSRNGGAIYNLPGATVCAAASDIAGLGGAEGISEKDLDRKDDLGLLFTKAFSTPGPMKFEWPDS